MDGGTKEARLLCWREDAGETRRVELVLTDDRAIVRERTSGPVTEAAYGLFAHAHEVRLHAAEADAVADEAGREYVEDVIEEFFEGGSMTLLDFEDWMCERGLDFGYVSRLGDVIAFRPRSA